MIDEKPKKEIARLIREHKTFLVCGHVRPDADCVGSQLALYLALKRLGREAVVWMSGEMPHTCAFLPGSGEVRTPPRARKEFEVTFVLDTPRPERLGGLASFVGSMPAVVNIDHHPSNSRWAHYNWVDPRASASAEFIYLLLGEVGMEIDRELATCIYAGIITDTGRFCYSNTTPHAHRLAAELIERGVAPEEVSERLYGQSPPAKVKLLGMVLDSLRTDEEGALAWVWLRREMYERSGARPQDAEGFINYARDMEGVKVAVLLEEQSGGAGVRVSLRSRDSRVDVNRIAGLYGGGGHAAAAGALIKGAPREVERELLGHVREAIREAGKAERLSRREKAGRPHVA